MRGASGFTPAISTIARWTGAVERSRSEGAPVAIVGDSRILFDTDLDRFEALTGIRPVQLAIHGTSPLTLLEDDGAAIQKFNGLLIVGLCGHDVLPAVRRIRRLHPQPRRLNLAVRHGTGLPGSTICSSGGSPSSIPATV